MPRYVWTDLGSSSALKAFAYKGKKGSFIGMSENEVKAAIKSALEVKAYDVHVRWGQEGGADIEASLGTTKIVIEGKGEGKTRQALGNNFLRVLGQILLRMTDDTAEYGVALPAHPSYIELVLKLPKRARQALRLDFYLVKRSYTTHEVGLFRWFAD